MRSSRWRRSASAPRLGRVSSARNGCGSRRPAGSVATPRGTYRSCDRRSRTWSKRPRASSDPMSATSTANDTFTGPPRADVVGSLLRPPALLRARTAWQSGRLSSADYKRVEDDAVNDAIALQEYCGLDVVTDGEMRRMFFTGVVTEALDGIELIAGQTTTWHGTGSADVTIQLPVAVTGTLRRRRSLATEEYSYARACTTKPVKVTLPSPLMLSYFWSPEHSTVAYADPFTMFADAAAIVTGEVRELAALGCRYIQIDAPELITLSDPTQVAYFDALGISGERML